MGGYIREPKNVDLIVGPSVLTTDMENCITQAIAQYKETGKKPVGVETTKKAGTGKKSAIKKTTKV